VKIYEFLWTEDRIEHIARHGVLPEDFEEVCFGQSLVRRIHALGENPAYQALGQTAEGRYLFCIAIQFPGGLGFPVMARPMTEKERRRFTQWKKQKR
jgi:uncharacterized DUF497 family protein